MLTLLDQCRSKSINVRTSRITDPSDEKIQVSFRSKRCWIISLYLSRVKLLTTPVEKCWLNILMTPVTNSWKKMWKKSYDQLKETLSLSPRNEKSFFLVTLSLMITNAAFLLAFINTPKSSWRWKYFHKKIKLLIMLNKRMNSTIYFIIRSPSASSDVWNGTNPSKIWKEVFWEIVSDYKSFWRSKNIRNKSLTRPGKIFLIRKINR